MFILYFSTVSYFLIVRQCIKACLKIDVHRNAGKPEKSSLVSGQLFISISPQFIILNERSKFINNYMHHIENTVCKIRMFVRILCI